MNIHVLFQGYPGRFEQGYLAWPTVVCVEHAGKKLLMDTGVATQRRHLPLKLAELGMRPEDIDLVVLSHLHFDHAQNWDMFPRARFVAHKSEVDHVRAGTDEWAYQPYILDDISRTGRLDIVERDGELMPGIDMIHVPGHTPGCLALLLHGETVTALAGDAVKNIVELASGQAPMVTDSEAAARSILAIRNAADIVIPGHDRVLHVLPNRIEARNGLELDLVRVPGVVPAGTPELVPFGFGPSTLPIAGS